MLKTGLHTILLFTFCGGDSLSEMSTPAMAFGAGLRNVLTSLWLMWATMFVVSRIYLLHDAYISASNRRTDEQWLLRQCKDPEFYSNLRQHTDLCTEVEKNARASLFLTALNSVASQTHACGTVSCLDLIFNMFSKLGWHVAALLLALMVLAPNLLYMLLLRKEKKWRPVAYAAALGDDAAELAALRTRWLKESELKRRKGADNAVVKLV